MHDAGGSALLASLILVLCIGGGALSGVVAKAAVDTGGPFELSVPPPPAVRRAGGRELHEFLEGRKAVAKIGCLACHRIGDEGNRRPGRPLTYVGSRLTARQIRHVLLHPRSPMPSFRGLPRNVLHAMVRFLTMLRRGRP